MCWQHLLVGGCTRRKISSFAGTCLLLDSRQGVASLMRSDLAVASQTAPGWGTVEMCAPAWEDFTVWLAGQPQCCQCPLETLAWNSPCHLPLCSSDPCLLPALQVETELSVSTAALVGVRTHVHSGRICSCACIWHPLVVPKLQPATGASVQGLPWSVCRPAPRGHIAEHASCHLRTLGGIAKTAFQYVSLRAGGRLSPAAAPLGGAGTPSG